MNHKLNLIIKNLDDTYEYEVQLNHKKINIGEENEFTLQEENVNINIQYKLKSNTNEKRSFIVKLIQTIFSIVLFWIFIYFDIIKMGGINANEYIMNMNFKLNNNFSSIKIIIDSMQEKNKISPCYELQNCILTDENILTTINYEVLKAQKEYMLKLNLISFLVTLLLPIYFLTTSIIYCNLGLIFTSIFLIFLYSFFYIIFNKYIKR